MHLRFDSIESKFPEGEGGASGNRLHLRKGAATRLGAHQGEKDWTENHYLALIVGIKRTKKVTAEKGGEREHNWRGSIPFVPLKTYLAGQPPFNRHQFSSPREEGGDGLKEFPRSLRQRRTPIDDMQGRKRRSRLRAEFLFHHVSPEATPESKVFHFRRQRIEKGRRPTTSYFLQFKRKKFGYSTRKS